MTIKVVDNAPKQPNKEGQYPALAASASPLNNWYTITKKVNVATVLKALNIKNVEIHNLRKGFIVKAS